MVSLDERRMAYNTTYTSCKNSPTFSSALLEAISKATETKDDHPRRKAQKPSPTVLDRGFNEENMSSPFNYPERRSKSIEETRAHDSLYAYHGRRSYRSHASSGPVQASSSLIMREMLATVPVEQKKVSQKNQEKGHKAKSPKSNSPKQPMSPGTRLASFINSLFSGGSVKRSRSRRSESSSAASTPSSSASMSEYLAKRNDGVVDSKPRSNLRSSGAVPRSERQGSRKVSFQMESESQSQSQSREHARVFDEKTCKESKDRDALGKKMQERLKYFESGVFAQVARKVEIPKADDEDDDLSSDASSDLFELENFKALDRGIYSTDLPVYETTDMETNKAIAIARRYSGC